MPETFFGLTTIEWLGAAAIFGGLLVIATIIMIRLQILSAQKDMFIKNLLRYEDEFDSETMIKHRNKFADQIINKAPHEEMKERVINFFESLGLALRMKALKTEMVWGCFSYYSIRWWLASQEYIKQERINNGNDETIFDDFRYLVEQMQKREIKEQKKMAKRKKKQSDGLNYFGLKQVDIEQFLNYEQDEKL